MLSQFTVVHVDIVECIQFAPASMHDSLPRLHDCSQVSPSKQGGLDRPRRSCGDSVTGKTPRTGGRQQSRLCFHQVTESSVRIMEQHIQCSMFFSTTRHLAIAPIPRHYLRALMRWFDDNRAGLRHALLDQRVIVIK